MTRRSLQLHARTALRATASPGLQRSVRLLQMSAAEFTQALHDAAERNPFLECDEAEKPPASPYPVRQRSDRTFALPAWDEAGDTPGLHAHLRGQLMFLRLTDRERLLSEVAIESLDDDGYLRNGAQDIATAARSVGMAPPPSDDETAQAWATVRALDPAGVGAVDLVDCLRLQLPQITCDRTRRVAGRIVDAHLPKLGSRDTTRLAAMLEVDVQLATAACESIRRLDPFPGRRMQSDRFSDAQPDVLVTRAGGVWTASLNDALVPRVRVNADYAHTLACRQPGAVNAPLSAALTEAQWLVGNVSQRFATVLAVAKAICRHQQAYFEHGPLALKPLGLRRIADEIGVHQSTVSRVTSSKTIATRYGMHPLKYFFARGLHTRSGSQCAPAAVRELVAELIHAESSSSVLSDGDLAGLLAQQGFSVARRTVTKYRQALRIPAADARRTPC